MDLPDDVILLIHQFDRPVTRPDWRTIHRMSNLQFHLDIAARMGYHCPKVIIRLITHPQSYFIFDISMDLRVLYIFDTRDWSKHRVKN